MSNIGDKYKFGPWPETVFTVISRASIGSSILISLEHPQSQHHIIMAEDALEMLGDKIEEPKPKFKVGDKLQNKSYPNIKYTVDHIRGHTYGIKYEGDTRVEMYSFEEIHEKAKLREGDPDSNLKAELQGLLGLQPGMSIIEAVKELKAYKLCVENVRKEIERAAPKLG